MISAEIKVVSKLEKRSMSAITPTRINNVTMILVVLFQLGEVEFSFLFAILIPCDQYGYYNARNYFLVMLDITIYTSKIHVSFSLS